jgi:hypothetical protein
VIGRQGTDTPLFTVPVPELGTGERVVGPRIGKSDRWVLASRWSSVRSVRVVDEVSPWPAGNTDLASIDPFLPVPGNGYCAAGHGAHLCIAVRPRERGDLGIPRQDRLR